MASNSLTDEEPRNLLDGIPTGGELKPPDSDYAISEVVNNFLGGDVLPMKEWPDYALLISFGYAYNMCLESIYWTLISEVDPYRLPRDIASHGNPRIFFDLERLCGKIDDQLTLAKKVNSESDFLPFLCTYNLLLQGVAGEIQYRLKLRRLNLRWLEYLQGRTEKALQSFLAGLTPGGKPDLSKLPAEFRNPIKRHVNALPWEDREDEISKAWIWFIDWINCRVSNRIKIPDSSQRKLELRFVKALEEDLKYLSAIYWSFAVSVKKSSRQGNPDNIARLEIHSRMRDERRKYFPPLRELSYIDEDGERRFLWAKAQRYDETGTGYVNRGVEAEEELREKRDDRIVELGMKSDPARLISEESIDKARTSKIESLKAKLTAKEQAFLNVLVRQIESAKQRVRTTRTRAKSRKVRLINVEAAAQELGVSRQMGHKYLLKIRKVGQEFGLKDLIG